MANNTKKERDHPNNNNLGVWTNERHVHFLNTMEASFVRSMFGQQHNITNSPPLDRYLPDTLDSTEDLGKERRRRRHSTSDIVESRGRRTDRKTRNSLSHISYHDQVVPQVDKRGDDKDKDHKDHFGTSLGTAH